MLDDDFYKALEDRYRGSRSLIKNRLKIYLPFIRAASKLDDSSALDIGCGRGEWLELLKENGISAQGIDINNAMLKSCFELGFDVIQTDGIQYLREQKNNSRIVISAFHVVEHINFDELQLLVKESLRVLKPGGILILETPNPENIKVATESFHLDPTHIKPIPSKLLSFLPEFYGYIRTKVLRLQESSELIGKKSVTLTEVIKGVSPDYAIVAQKNADRDILKHSDDLFFQDIGLSFDSLALNFENRMLNIETKACEAENKANEAENKANEAENKANEAENKANEAIKQCTIIMNSTSWRLTIPFRSCFSILKLTKTKISHKLKSLFLIYPNMALNNVISSLIYKIQLSPKLKTILLYFLSKTPITKEKLKQFIDCHSREPRKKNKNNDAFIIQIKKEIEERKKSFK